MIDEATAIAGLDRRVPGYAERIREHAADGTLVPFLLRELLGQIVTTDDQDRRLAVLGAEAELRGLDSYPALYSRPCGRRTYGEPADGPVTVDCDGHGYLDRVDGAEVGALWARHLADVRIEAIAER